MSNFRVKFILPQLLALIVLSPPATAQSNAGNKKIFTQAENYFLYEEYELAKPLYLELESSTNMNIKYKIGVCYLNIPGEKDKAVPYLTAAVTDASSESKSGQYREKRAPLEAYFALARACMINSDYEKARNTLETLKKLAAGGTGKNGSLQNSEFIDQELRACDVAVRLREQPVRFNKKPLGTEFSQGTRKENTAVSFDGNTLVFTERHGMENSIFCSRKKNGKWQTPEDITSQINGGTDCSTCSLNSDGTELFLYKRDDYDGALYSALFSNGEWTAIKKLNANINTKYYESHASVSADGKRLYFTSNRDGGQGNLDIYVSEKEASGDWGPAVNMGTEINTPFNEDTPFITKNDSVLFFSSEGHMSMGGYDIFKSLRNGSSWSTPENIGYPINTSDEEKFFQPFNNEENAYFTFASDRGKKDIYYLSLGGPRGRKLGEISGLLTLSDTTMAFDKSFRISLVDRGTGDTVDVGYPNKFTGRYSFYASPGKYRLIYAGTGYFSQALDTAITRENYRVALNLDITLERDLTAQRAEQGLEKLNFNEIPEVAEMDSGLIIKNMRVNDLNDKAISDSDVLYYTVQVMALHNPVNLGYFKFVPDIRVLFNEFDKFYRYTTGIFYKKEEAIAHKEFLLRKGYPDDIFVKKVSRE